MAGSVISVQATRNIDLVSNHELPANSFNDLDRVNLFSSESITSDVYSQESTSDQNTIFQISEFFSLQNKILMIKFIPYLENHKTADTRCYTRLKT